MGTTVVSVVSQITGNISLGVGMDRSALPGGADPLPPGVQDSVLTGPSRNAKNPRAYCTGIFIMPYWGDALVPGELDGSLCRSQTGNRHTVGRAGYIVESNLVAELYRSGIAAMLTADAQFEVRLHRAAPVRWHAQ